MRIEHVYDDNGNYLGRNIYDDREPELSELEMLKSTLVAKGVLTKAEVDGIATVDVKIR